MQLSTSAGGSLSDYDDLAGLGGSKVFDLGNNVINLNYSVWKGSGNKLDMALLVPTFAANSNDYIYGWAKFGPNPYPTNNGPEEWITFGAPRSVPEPSTMLLLGSGLVGLVGFRRKYRK